MRKIPCKCDSTLPFRTSSYTKQRVRPSIHMPMSFTRLRWCNRLNISTSAINSRSPFWLFLVSSLTATSVPSSILPSKTRPNPPSPKILFELNLSVAFSSSVNVNVLTESIHEAMLDMRDIGVELAMLLDKKDPMPASHVAIKYLT